MSQHVKNNTYPAGAFSLLSNIHNVISSALRATRPIAWRITSWTKIQQRSQGSHHGVYRQTFFQCPLTCLYSHLVVPIGGTPTEGSGFTSVDGNG